MSKELLDELNKASSETADAEGHEEIDNPFTALLTNSYFDQNDLAEVLKPHKYEYVGMHLKGEALESNLESYDGQEVEWVFKVDGVTYALYGYYSSYEYPEIDRTIPVEVELSTKTIQVYKAS